MKPESITAVEIEVSLAPFPPAVALEQSLLNLDPPPKSAAERESRLIASDKDASLIDYLPGYPGIALHDSSAHTFLRRELATPVIDELYHMLWIFCVKSGHNIDPLHNQRIKGREIIPTERAKLHMVWTRDRIYIKTLPVCLLNHAVWDTFLHPNTEDPDAALPDRSAALGFVRSYALLIQSPLDFAIAKEAMLIPEGADMDWIRWEKFMAHFRDIQDDQVSKRYRYGQIRLNRLNWLLRFIQPRSSTSFWFYQRHTWSVGAMVSESFPMLLFAFASMSLVLSSMQVALAMPGSDLAFAGLDANGVIVMQRSFWVFSVITIFLAGLTWLYLVVFPLSIVLTQVLWALSHKGVANPNSRIKISAIHDFARV